MSKNSINERLRDLRQAMANAGISGYLIPSADPHQSEYVAPHWMARTWISGFTGSAGVAVVCADHAGLWTDSRYFIQAESELADSDFELQKQLIPGRTEHEDWLADHMKAGEKVGIDGRVLSVDAYERMQKKFQEKGIELVTEIDLIGEVWADRPSMPTDSVWVHDIVFARTRRTKKLEGLRSRMAAQGIDICLLTALDDIAWLFNLRGSDVEFNPVFYAYALVSQSEAHIFFDLDKLDASEVEDIAKDGVQMHGYEAIFEHLKTISPSAVLHLDPRQTATSLYKLLPKDHIQRGSSIVSDMKGCKSPEEVERVREVMEKDGVSLVKLLMWLEKEVPNGGVTEFDVSEKLISLRRLHETYVGESFPAIVGYGPNGAIVHYRPPAEGSSTLKPESILLIDCGGQYLDGTTDITRTIAMGPPTDEQRRNFTLVLKGHIALDTAVFPRGVAGYQLDSLARMPLWQDGLNFLHGTGHGVGYFLNVHEGPQGIHHRAKGNGAVPFREGMITSNEPGFYLQGQYGIRIENLVLTVPVHQTAFGEFLGFENLSLCPLDWKLIDQEVLTKPELDWVKRYQSMVYKRLSGFLNYYEAEWLHKYCFLDPEDEDC